MTFAPLNCEYWYHYSYTYCYQVQAQTAVTPCALRIRISYRTCTEYVMRLIGNGLTYNGTWQQPSPYSDGFPLVILFSSCDPQPPTNGVRLTSRLMRVRVRYYYCMHTCTGCRPPKEDRWYNPDHARGWKCLISWPYAVTLKTSFPSQ